MICWLPYSSRETRLKVLGRSFTCFLFANDHDGDRQRKNFPDFRTGWRRARPDGRRSAGANASHASILRYYTEGAVDNETGRPRERGEILVVTKIDGAKACHLAYVDAGANPGANRLAQEAADNSDGFDCEKDEPKKVSKTGKGPM